MENKALKDLEISLKEHQALMLELHQHLLKTCSETADARLKLADAMRSLTESIVEYSQELDEAELAKADAEAEFAAELAAEHANENNLPIKN